MWLLCSLALGMLSCGVPASPQAGEVHKQEGPCTCQAVQVDVLVESVNLISPDAAFADDVVDALPAAHRVDAVGAWGTQASSGLS